MFAQSGPREPTQQWWEASDLDPEEQAGRPGPREPGQPWWKGSEFDPEVQAGRERTAGVIGPVLLLVVFVTTLALAVILMTLFPDFMK
jgi:hypothetical protein